MSLGRIADWSNMAALCEAAGEEAQMGAITTVHHVLRSVHSG